MEIVSNVIVMVWPIYLQAMTSGIGDNPDCSPVPAPVLSCSCSMPYRTDKYLISTTYFPSTILLINVPTP